MVALYHPFNRASALSVTTAPRSSAPIAAGGVKGHERSDFTRHVAAFQGGQPVYQRAVWCVTAVLFREPMSYPFSVRVTYRFINEDAWASGDP